MMASLPQGIVLFNKVVKTVRWGGSFSEETAPGRLFSVQVEGEDGEMFLADHVIVTVPLGEISLASWFSWLLTKCLLLPNPAVQPAPCSFDPGSQHWVRRTELDSQGDWRRGQFEGDVCKGSLKPWMCPAIESGTLSTLSSCAYHTFSEGGSGDFLCHYSAGPY